MLKHIFHKIDLVRNCMYFLFQSKHSGRKLQWHHHMSNGTITLANAVGTYDLVSFIHISIIVLFLNEVDLLILNFELAYLKRTTLFFEIILIIGRDNVPNGRTFLLGESPLRVAHP
jgi:hypothetical protein